MWWGNPGATTRAILAIKEKDTWSVGMSKNKYGVPGFYKRVISMILQ
jgi:hypothetical protein